LIPVILVYGILLLVGRALSSMGMDESRLSSIPMGLAALWLLSYKLKRLGGGSTFFAATGIATTAAFITAVCSSGLDPQTATAGSLLRYLAGALAVLLGMTLSRRVCGRHYTAGRFMSWLLLWLVVMFMCLMVPPAIMMASVMRMVMGAWVSVFPLIVGGTMSAAGVYILLLPFMILAFRNSLYRERFESIFRFATAGSGPSSEEAGGADESGKEITG